MSKTMLINTMEGRECRIAITDNGRLEELYTERASSASQVGNIYKGKITNIEPSIQAAFIEFGGIKNGFLHISDVHPQFFPQNQKAVEQVGRRTAHRTRPPIQECLKRGQEILVQMTKQGIGTKGPTLTSYLSIPGRLVVMMPGMTHSGISRKIEDEETRGKLRKMLDQVKIPENMGIIVRTAGIDRTKRDIQRDVAYLARLWKSIDERVVTCKAPAEIYEESDLVIRTLRDVFDSDIERILCDSEDVGLRIKEFLELSVPRAKCKIELYTGPRSLFEIFGVEEEIGRIQSRVVKLQGGGSLVIDQTEALVAIDVNSGSFRQHSSAEANALKLNLLAAEEVARQLRLRDLGGVIVVDFIDLRDENSRRQVERKMRDLLKDDRAKSKVLRLSSFGLMEMTRQRLRPSLKQSVYSRCPHCNGAGLVMSEESVALKVVRQLQAACACDVVANIEVAVAPKVAHYLSNTQRKNIVAMETQFEKAITIIGRDDLITNDVEITCTDSRQASVAWEKLSAKAVKNIDGQIVDIKKLAKGKPSLATQDDLPLLEEDEADTSAEVASPTEETPDASEVKPKRKSRRRGRRGGKKHRKPAAESQTEEAAQAPDATPSSENDTKPADEPAKSEDAAKGDADEKPKDEPKDTPRDEPKDEPKDEAPAADEPTKEVKKRRVVKRVKKVVKRVKKAMKAEEKPVAESDATATPAEETEAPPAKKVATKRAAKKTAVKKDAAENAEEKPAAEADGESGEDAKPKAKRKRRSRRGGKGRRKPSADTADNSDNSTSETPSPESKPATPATPATSATKE